MSRRYLLDTGIISDLVRRPDGIVARRIVRLGEETVCTSVVVACELRFGAEKSGSSRLRQQIEKVLFALEVLPLENPVSHHYAALRTHLEKAGTPIGPNDLLIAAHAQALDLTLVSGNVRKFDRVPGLAVENWLEEESALM